MPNPVERLEQWCDKRRAELLDMEPVPADFDVANESRDGRLVNACRTILSRYWTASDWSHRQQAKGENNILWATEAQSFYRSITALADALNPEPK